MLAISESPLPQAGSVAAFAAFALQPQPPPRPALLNLCHSRFLTTSRFDATNNLRYALKKGEGLPGSPKSTGENYDIFIHADRSAVATCVSYAMRTYGVGLLINALESNMASRYNARWHTSTCHLASPSSSPSRSAPLHDGIFRIHDNVLQLFCSSAHSYERAR